MDGILVSPLQVLISASRSVWKRRYASLVIDQKERMPKQSFTHVCASRLKGTVFQQTLEQRTSDLTLMHIYKSSFKEMQMS